MAWAQQAHSVSNDHPHVFRIDNDRPDCIPAFRRYVYDPRIIAMVEEMIGGRARIEQSGRAPCACRTRARTGAGEFHRGAYSGLAYTENGLYHYPFVKALTNLTDLGPDDGGTAVIAGSHKLPGSLQRATIEAALEDPTLIRPGDRPGRIDPAVHHESLLHSAGIMRSGRERTLIIGGYSTTHFQAWKGYDPDPAILATLTEDEQARYAGSDRWHWAARFRTLA